MQEDFLQFVWAHAIFNQQTLETTVGNKLEVINPGQLNFQSGPDFLESHLVLDQVSWYGNVEIHVKSSDWFKHQHHQDPAYNNVILHVVYEMDQPVFYPSGDEIPTLELKGRIRSESYLKYENIQCAKHIILCEKYLNSIPKITWAFWLERLTIERIDRKAIEIAQIHNFTKGNWSQTLFVWVAKCMGFKTNAIAMQELALNIPYNILQKNANNSLAVNAILFGVSGLLKKGDELYPQQLLSEFDHQQRKHGLSVLSHQKWEFKGCRPTNFPTIRIAQLAGLIENVESLFGCIVNQNQPLKEIFSQVKLASYWKTHYSFFSESKPRDKNLGTGSIQNLEINAIATFLYFYGKETVQPEVKQQAIDRLQKLPPENNSIIQNWKQNNIFADNAATTQALIELQNNYCSQKKCLTCAIGTNIIAK